MTGIQKSHQRWMDIEEVTSFENRKENHWVIKLWYLKTKCIHKNVMTKSLHLLIFKPFKEAPRALESSLQPFSL